MKKQSSMGAVLAAVVITLIIAALTGWGSSTWIPRDRSSVMAT